MLNLTADHVELLRMFGSANITLPRIPDDLTPGMEVEVGHWKAEVTGIERHHVDYGNGLEPVFMVGLRLKF